ncbi:MAG TPA: SDR family oxidoreductase [Candidatus Binataceae bacterium]|jgi:NAD(P)-dependent dehydrogenase (short-subunit alcohol dehydrogenase family)|nr:SDR family oxidoreductase [Candidatus Binataceae bacterium]
MSDLLAGKVALVTGGGSGIGRATAVAFAREGAKVVVADIVDDGGNRTVDLIREAGGEARFIRTDVSLDQQVSGLIGATVDAFGRLDCAFNNAGIEQPIANIPDITEQQWHRILAVDLTGVWLCMKHEIPQMLKQGGGSIVNTSSIMGLVATTGMAAYNAAKGGVAQLTRSGALEYAKANIRVNAVAPGFILTPMVARNLPADSRQRKAAEAVQPMGRMGQAEEIAEAVIWLSSDAASFVTGVVMPVDGAWTAR